MTDSTQSNAATELPQRSRRAMAAGATLVVLVVLSDLLFFPHEPGISVAIFLMALIAGIVMLNRDMLGRPHSRLFIALAVLGTLPLVEADNPGWRPMALGGVSLLALAATGNLEEGPNWPGALLRFAVLAPVRLLADALDLLAGAGRQTIGAHALRPALVWIVPAASAAVFAFLFVAANPVLERGLHTIHLETLFQYLDPARVLLWGFVAALCWPLLMPRLLRWRPAAEMQGPSMPKPESVVFGAEAIRNSLIVFNALFALQTLMDLAYLWGGVRLPDGISYAEYAHRGAYPLIVTALLAAAFVLAAMRRNGPGETFRLIRALVYAWIAQNVWLVISSGLRLKLYVDEYGLTELRLYAGVWMALVAVGLVLIVAKIALGRSNKWLVTSNLVSLSLTLWAVAFVDVPATIAWHNLLNSQEMGAAGQPIDIYQMNDLGPAAIPAIDFLISHEGGRPSEAGKALGILRDEFASHLGGWGDWQSWTWRGQRLRQYVAEHPLAPEPMRLDN